MHSNKRNNTSKKTSKSQKTTSNKKSNPVCDKIYPGHPEFSELTNKISYPKTLNHLRNDVPDDVRKHLDDAIDEMNRSQKKHFLKVIASLSDDQYHHVITHIASMFDFRQSGSASWCLRRGLFFFRIGMRVLAGEHPHTKVRTKAQSPRLPIAPQIKKRDVGPVEGSSEWLKLQENLNNLPLELFDMIKEAVIDNLLLGPIYPHHDLDGVYSPGKSENEWLPCKLLELYRTEAKKKSISSRMLRDNVYVIGAGDIAATTNFIKHSSARRQKQMCRFQLILGREDYYISAAERSFGSYKGLCDEFLLFMDTDRPPYYPPLEILDLLHLLTAIAPHDVLNPRGLNAPRNAEVGRPRHPTEEDTINCVQAWSDKIEFLLREADIPISHLDIDLTDAYLPDGTYMGDKIARWFRFKKGIPNLTIRAPSVELEEEIRQVIMAANGVKPPGPAPTVLDYTTGASRGELMECVANNAALNTKSDE